MIKYKITFDFNIENVLEYDSDEQGVDILEIDDIAFRKAFDTNDKIKEFQDWYNNGLSEDKQISIINIKYDNDFGETGVLYVTLKTKLEDELTFAKEIVDYLFEDDLPRVNYHVHGNAYDDYWNYHKDSPDQKTVEVDYDDWASIDSYSNVTITII